MNRRILIPWGTRPELIKLFPVVKQLEERGATVDFVCTGQHSAILANLGFDPGVSIFELDGDEPSSNEVSHLVSNLVTRLSDLCKSRNYDFSVVQGDTASTFAGALASFLNGVNIAHVEAGLRTHDLSNPFPEEGFRRTIAALAKLHFTPTSLATKNVLMEGVNPNHVFEVGNTVVDAFHWVSQYLDGLGQGFSAATGLGEFLEAGTGSVLLLTAHRRESWGRMDSIAEAIHLWVTTRPSCRVVLPLHPNPIVTEAFSLFRDLPNALMTEPLSYADMVLLLNRVEGVITDSGGLAEEATTLGIPTVVLREKTERVEALEIGLAKLGGTSPEGISLGLSWLDHFLASERPRLGQTIFGDGDSAARIAEKILSESP